ncbi:Alpha-ketoglutarate-dependent dioxygenase alkB 6 [Beauveria bassiana]|uniref:Alkbh6 protein n=1 Tax=Beauveria bassiana (strain ARSEF 2860) TaxID=655819 RepID=J4UL39_BEAB2|nr:Alkbh6 protein [Beauveria bassiana ARSEF 2860]EJP65157.1 Alkbh6 protein [Beauveria bassiana ARSEF 2860]KAF1731842.1 Alpha-ketoglutarate-dependent dioxygenase alkB 6 [Beauveria bassiana]KAH8716087.1 Alpha-ketoglutarate-dependent dioxygenase alkB 6 [Beauveria bassiana]
MVAPSNPGVTLPANLEATRIESIPSTAYYIPNFISIEEEQLILDKIATAPKPRWKQLTHRRLQTWPSDLVRDKLLEAVLPPWLESPVVSRLQSIPVSPDDTVQIFSGSPHSRPNHVLINEYPPGVGIMPHKDGAAYWPVVCTVSLGASLCLNLHRSKDDGALNPEPAWRILQEPRSLLITAGELYTDYLHGIADIEEDVNLSAETVANWLLLRDPSAFEGGRNVRQTRTSLTYRDVLKVSKAANKIGMFLKR